MLTVCGEVSLHIQSFLPVVVVTKELYQMDVDTLPCVLNEQYTVITSPLIKVIIAISSKGIDFSYQ